MAFVRLKSILQKKTHERSAVREALVLRDLGAVWEKEVLPTLPAEVRDHVKRAAHLESVKQGVLTVAVYDANTAALLLLHRATLLKRIQVQQKPQAQKIQEVRIVRRSSPAG